MQVKARKWDFTGFLALGALGAAFLAGLFCLGGAGGFFGLGGGAGAETGELADSDLSSKNLTSSGLMPC